MTLPWQVDLPISHTYAHALQVMASNPPGLLAKRYEAGEYEEIWQHIHDLGGHVRDEEHVLADVMHVLRLTMERCGINLTRIVKRLQELGLAVQDARPRADMPVLAAQLERYVGVLPLSICGWYQWVGEVDLRGFDTEEEYEIWPGRQILGEFAEEGDPLVMNDAGYVFEYNDDTDDSGLYRLEVPADIYHKFFISGGASYAVIAPDAVADGNLVDEPHNLPFIDYLRMCFRWYGYPQVDIPPLRTLSMLKF